MLRCASSGSSVTTATLVPCDRGTAQARTCTGGTRRADDEDGVERLEQRAKPRPIGREVPRETRVVLRKPGPGAERLLPDGRVEPLCDLDERVPGPPLVCSGADDDGGALGAVEQADERVDGGGVGGCGAQHGPGGGGLIALVRRRSGPVVHRHDDERRAAPSRRGVPRAADRAGDVLRPDRLLDRDGVRAREPLEMAGEERLVGEVAPVLLSDEHDERRAVDARRRQGADGVAEPGGRVEQDEGRLVPSDRPAGRDPDDRPFVQPQDELEVGRQVDEQRHLGRAGVREHPGQPARAKDLDCRVAHGRLCHCSP